MPHYLGMTAENVRFKAHRGDTGDAYFARPTTSGSIPGVVMIHHMPAWDDGTIEATRKLAHAGFMTIAPHLYFRHGDGSPDDVSARARASGGMSDEEVMGDIAGCMAFLRDQDGCNGKIGAIGFCSGGRHAFLAACLVDGLDAAVDCYGGYVIVDDPSKQITPQRPVNPIELAEKMKAPLLGIFGNSDKNPDRAQVDETERRLKALHKTYEFHRYDDASHAFMSPERKSYRPEQANDAWRKIIDFFNKYLAS